ncbi:hypothetical protein V7S43_001666 [Phytophthora oleae]|uniref:PH domain-containing protein n=1 Tax=Phytophthora oleae TaxID=2107226 RepID=A0ABD3G5X8_9STRA
MACGKLEVQSCNLLWFLSTVYLVNITQPKFASAKRTTQMAINLVVQRPRVAGGTLTIRLDSTVRLVNTGKDKEHNIIRLQYGSKAKHLAMRAARSHDRKQWSVALSAAISQSQQIQKPTKSSKTSHGVYAASPPAHSSFRRVVRRNIPSAMQFVITVGQIIASAH